jgi:hypothetical protein
MTRRNPPLALAPAPPPPVRSYVRFFRGGLPATPPQSPFLSTPFFPQPNRFLGAVCWATVVQDNARVHETFAFFPAPILLFALDSARSRSIRALIRPFRSASSGRKVCWQSV